MRDEKRKALRRYLGLAAMPLAIVVAAVNPWDRIGWGAGLFILEGCAI